MAVKSTVKPAGVVTGSLAAEIEIALQRAVVTFNVAVAGAAAAE